jgi:flagellar biosynthesis protein FlhF
MRMPANQSAGLATVLAAAPSQVVERPGQQLLQSQAAKEIIGIQVAKDVEDLKKLVAGLVDTMHKKEAPQVPEELFDYYLKLVDNQVAEELASDIVCTLRRSLRPEHLQNPSFVRDKIAEQIEKLIPASGPIVRTKATGPHVVALIGPTGVGKTTTIAKLAANLKLREKRKVGLITIDTYRIAAIDQLERYAQILGSKLRVVASPEDLREAVRSFSDVDFILIDTAGRSPRDTLKINELKTFLDAATPDEIHLVLSSTASQGCVELAMERFGEVHFDRVIFTKLDEASHVGVVLNAIKKLGKSLSYVTTGQDVPDDIEVGHGRTLAIRMLEEGTRL